MEVLKTFELVPVDGRKSFYGKARVIVGGTDKFYLLSYDTIVAMIHNGKYTRLWDGNSATTTRHIKAFKNYYNIKEI